MTAVNEKGAHPYHCISKDRKSVYGWVDRAAVIADQLVKKKTKERRI